MTIVTYVKNMILNNKMKGNNEKETAYDLSPRLLIEKEDSSTAPVTNKASSPTTFQRAMKLTVIIGQCFGLNPVLGVCETDTSKLRFTVFSMRCLYSFLTILGQCLVFGLCVAKLANDSDPSLGSNSSIVFYGTNGMTTILFLHIAIKWPKLCQDIAKIEDSDPNLDNGLVKKCNVSCIVVLLLALLEHLLSDMSGIVIAKDCQPDTNLFEAFVLQSFGWAWTFLHYNHVIGLLTVLLNLQCTFNWNFADAFVICISWYLTSRLKQVNDRIVAARGKYVSSTFWRTMREDWCKAVTLVRRVDDVISGIIFISFANNLFFICLQFLHLLDDGIKPSSACGKPLSTRPLKGFEHSVYFLYSFGFLLSRSIAVSLIAAKVHTASQLPAQTLYEVPAAAYCIEVQRFMDQIHGDTVALSGLQFFHVKRGLLLTVAGTIVTYELVLMQFVGVTPTSAPPLASLLLPSEKLNSAVIP